MINFDETIQAVYFLSGDEQDWLAGINQGADGTVEIKYRFRYYNPLDGDPHKGSDQKSWYGCTMKPGEPLAKALEIMQQMMDMLQAKGFVPKGGVACKLVRGNMTAQQMVTEFEKLPFVHKKEASE